jgi:hypothetical protein
VVNRINPIRDNTTGAQQPVPTGFIAAVIFIGRHCGASSGKGKGRRESNFRQHF